MSWKSARSRSRFVLKIAVVVGAAACLPVRAQQPGYMDTPEGVGAYFLDPDANLIELWSPRRAP